MPGCRIEQGILQALLSVEHCRSTFYDPFGLRHSYPGSILRLALVRIPSVIAKQKLPGQKLQTHTIPALSRGSFNILLHL
jgi:hypothetical protein